MKVVGKEGFVKTCVKHSTMEEDVGTTRRLERRKGIAVLGLFHVTPEDGLINVYIECFYCFNLVILA